MAITTGVTLHLTASREYTGLLLKQSTCSSKWKLVEKRIWIFTWLHIIMLRRWWDPWWRQLSVAHKKHLPPRILTAMNTADLIPRKTFIKYALLVGLNCSRDLQFLHISEKPSFSWTHSWTTFPTVPCIKYVPMTEFWPAEYDQDWCVPLWGLVHKNYSSTISPSFSSPGWTESTLKTFRRVGPHDGRMWVPEWLCGAHTPPRPALTKATMDWNMSEK